MDTKRRVALCRCSTVFIISVGRNTECQKILIFEGHLDACVSWMYSTSCDSYSSV